MSEETRLYIESSRRGHKQIAGAEASWVLSSHFLIHWVSTIDMDLIVTNLGTWGCWNVVLLL